MDLKRFWARFTSNLSDPVVRGNVLALAGGKLIGLTLLLTAMGVYLPPVLHAADGPSPEINALNTMWVLVAAFLVFCMQVGFVMLEAGFARSRESINILVEGIVDTCICGVLFWAWGFAFMFEPGNGFIGTTGFFLSGLPETYGTTGIPLLAFWVFQFAFADTCSTITSGAMVGRCGFVGDILYSIGVTGFIYPIIGHWAWGPDGWLAVMAVPFRDFAGSTVVHSIGGAISLIGAIALGPRLGRVFRRDGGGPPMPHNIIMGAVGGVILWFGWYGFNPGSTLSAMDMQGIGRVSFNTTLAACAAGLASLFYVYSRVEEVGPRHHGQRLPRRPGGDHRAVLLGQPARRLLHRPGRRRARPRRHRPARVRAHRRSDRRGSGASGLRHLGHVVARPVRHRRLRLCRRPPASTRPSASRACSTAAAWTSSCRRPSAAPRSCSPPSPFRWC